VGGERLGGFAIDAHLARAQRAGRFRAAHRDHGFLQQRKKARRDAQGIDGAEERACADAGLKHRQLRRALAHGLNQRGDLLRVEIRHLGERRRVQRHAAALRDQAGELLAEPRLEHGDALAFHLAMRVLASARRSETLRTSARVS
jgi:hypothetical protein